MTRSIFFDLPNSFKTMILAKRSKHPLAQMLYTQAIIESSNFQSLDFTKTNTSQDPSDMR